MHEIRSDGCGTIQSNLSRINTHNHAEARQPASYIRTTSRGANITDKARAELVWLTLESEEMRDYSVVDEVSTPDCNTCQHVHHMRRLFGRAGIRETRMGNRRPSHKPKGGPRHSERQPNYSERLTKRFLPDARHEQAHPYAYVPSKSNMVHLDPIPGEYRRRTEQGTSRNCRRNQPTVPGTELQREA